MTGYYHCRKPQPVRDHHRLLTTPSIEEAFRLQEELASYHRTVADISGDHIHSIAGAGTARRGSWIVAAVSVFSFPSLALTVHAAAVCPIPFPYFPGLFAFHVGPAIVRAYRALQVKPDFLILPGHGTAHPVRFGMACHIGVALGVRSIGVAKKLLIGHIDDTVQGQTGMMRILDYGEQIGVAIRPATGRRMLYVSPGHRTDTIQAAEIVRATILPGRGYPEPLAHARCLARACSRMVGDAGE